MEPRWTTYQAVAGPAPVRLARCVAVLLLCKIWCADLAPVEVEEVEQQRAQKIHQCHRPFDVPQRQTTVQHPNFSAYQAECAFLRFSHEEGLFEILIRGCTLNAGLETFLYVSKTLLEL